MKLSTRGEYASQAILDIALHQQDGPVKIREIAKRQGIPLKYLENILLTLQRSGVARSKRGAHGGYYLARPADAITVGEVIRAMDGPLAPIDCVSVSAYQQCPRESICGLKWVWREVRDAIADILDHTTFADVIRHSQSATEAPGPRTGCVEAG
jgi:Rrf2 family cysteine metabolism transcriptional repressor